MKPSVSFLIVNYHTSDLVLKLVESIRMHIRQFDYEILVGDNSMDDAERMKISALDKVIVTDLGGNLGFVKANNRLFARAKNDVVIAINPDTLLTDNSLETIVEYVVAHPEVGVAGPKLINADGSYQISFYRFPSVGTLIEELFFFGFRDPYAYTGSVDSERCVDVVKGACLVFRKNVIRDAVFFDERFVMYSEEVDFCRRMKIQGLRTVYFPGATILHFGEQSSGKKNASKYSLYHYYRSKIYYFRIHHERNVLPLIILALMVKTIIFALIGKFDVARLHFEIAVLITKQDS